MNLVEMADRCGRAFTETLSRDDQRGLGQFMTPPTIATFMARRFVADVCQRHVRILEPAAGAGILAAAAVQELLDKVDGGKPDRIDLLLYEIDSRLVPGLAALCEQMQRVCARAAVFLDWRIENSDFLLSELALNGKSIESLLTISNPPFFKLNKAADIRAKRHAYAVYGQPNIYALFMASTARLTTPTGKWCFITPRSWMNGSYFKAARKTMFHHLAMDSLHAFESRKEGFEADAVLQEMVISWASGRSLRNVADDILLTRSQGTADLEMAQSHLVPIESVITNDEHAIVTLPAPRDDPLEHWTARLNTYGLKVSTGPVVAFRASEFIREQSATSTVPLLWLQHVGQQEINWPIRKKREHIEVTARNAWMLVPNAPMVVMRRFSPKESARRVTCAPYAGLLPGKVLGLENHLNYIYRPAGGMTPCEVRGLSAFLASSLVDSHFRARAGSTQVNAADLRKLPLPSREVIEEIGRAVSSKPDLAEIDDAVRQTMGLEPHARLAA